MTSPPPGVCLSPIFRASAAASRAGRTAWSYVMDLFGDLFLGPRMGHEIPGKTDGKRWKTDEREGFDHFECG